MKALTYFIGCIPTDEQFLKIRIGSCRLEVFCKRGVLKNFAKFTRKTSLPEFIKKETQAQVFYYEFCEDFKNTFFYRTPPVAASDTWQLFARVIVITWSFNYKIRVIIQYFCKCLKAIYPVSNILHSAWLKDSKDILSKFQRVQTSKQKSQNDLFSLYFCAVSSGGRYVTVLVYQILIFWWYFPEAYSKPCQTSKMDCFTNIVNDY